MKSLFKSALASVAMLALAAAAQAKDTVVWWDFLGGGDGVRMKTLLEEFNKTNPDIEIKATTLEWGDPFYTKVQTSAAVGEGPDIMTYHLSRMPLGVTTGALRELTAAELDAAGIKPAEFGPANFKAAQIGGKQYAVPFDIHALILYYNKDALKAAGLLGDDGLPKGLDGVANFEAALKKLTGGKTKYGLSMHTAAGDSQWRVYYSLLGQQDVAFLKDGKVLGSDVDTKKAIDTANEMAKWVKNGWAPANVEYPASVALFTSGQAALHFNGVWEVPTMADLAKSGKLGFDWGAVRVPVLYAHPATWADSHAFAIPNRKGKELSPEKVANVLKVVHWFNSKSTFWASAGHIPAYLPASASAEFKAMQPNATYSILQETAVFDPSSKIAGVASPIYTAMTNYFVPAVNGQLDPTEAVKSMKEELQGLLK